MIDERKSVAELPPKLAFEVSEVRDFDWSRDELILVCDLICERGCEGIANR